MKTTFALSVVATLLAANSFAGPDVIIRQRARELSNQNNVRQGVAPPTQAAQPPQPAAAPATPAAPKSAGLTRLETSLAAIKAPVTAEQKNKLAGDIIAAAEGNKPSQASAAKLAEDLCNALASKPLAADKRARLAQELHAVLNPAKYPQAKMDGIYNDIQAIFQVNGSDRKQAVEIAEDVKALATNSENPKPAAKQ